MDGLYNRRNTTDGGAGRIQYIQPGDRNYPKRFKEQKGMPRQLWLIGRMPDDDRPSAAIVGARRCSGYGSQTARFFAAELAKAGVQIISGMAWGIDGMAHMGALEAGGDTFAVLGSGADVCYPAGHRKLYQRLTEEGGVLSEQRPGTPPLPQHFPARNRIISALADVVLVIEAKEKSGSLITADFALEQGKDVFAVPGRIDDSLSRGCLNLIKQGAGVADSPRTVLEALGINEADRKREEKFILANEENIVYSVIRLQSASLEEIAAKTDIPVQKAASILAGLELKGCIREVHRNEYVRTDLRIDNGKVSGDSRVSREGEDN